MRGFFASLLIILMSGCYSTRGFIDSKYKTIYVEPVKNKIKFTQETQEYSKYRSFPALFENDFTAALIDRFNLDGALKVDNRYFSQLRLETEINDFVRDVLRYTDSDSVEEYRLKLFFKYRLYDNETNELIKENSLIADANYSLSGSTATSEEGALKELFVDAARRLVEDVTEAW